MGLGFSLVNLCFAAGWRPCHGEATFHTAIARSHTSRVPRRNVRGVPRTGMGHLRSFNSVPTLSGIPHRAAAVAVTP